jgi:uncharacterized protein with von Willebrand factor type A (vWA) domain
LKRCWRSFRGVFLASRDDGIEAPMADRTYHQEPEQFAIPIVEFCRFARDNGLPVGIQQTLDAVEVAKATGADRTDLAFGLRTVLSSSKEEWDLFSELFELFWSTSQAGSAESSEGRKDARFRSQRPQASSRALMTLATGEASSPDREGKDVSGASAQQRLQKVDLSDVPHDDLAALERLSLQLFRKMSLRLSRRRRIDRLTDRVDIRRTIRRSISHGGDPIELAFQAKKPRKRKLVIFLDVSGSMNSYSLFLVRFAYALQKYFKRVNTFLFSTNVVEITDALRKEDLASALRELSEREAGWAGGTKIGASLRDFRRNHGGKLLSRDTLFIILSDGWDTGDPEMLGTELRAIKRRLEKVIWLNPLLGLEDYSPATRGMSAALPHVDVFAASHNLDSLLALERHL